MQSSPRSLAPRIIAGLLATVMATFVVGSQVLESRSVAIRAATEPANPAAISTGATATPTPRVIAIPESTSPTPRASLTPAPTQTVAALPATIAPPTPAAVPIATLLPTPTSGVIATDAPVESQPPTPVPAPSATMAPPPTLAVLAVDPTQTPPLTVPATAAPARSVRLEFTADAWAGGYYRGDGRAYGRPWSAVYGAFSAYPRAVLSFALDMEPDGPAALVVTGLDDEWVALNDVALEVNGQPVFSGAAPFANWDGLGDGAGAAWTRVQFTIPVGVLHSGSNEIVVANLTRSGNFNMPPYVLLSDATLQLGPPDAPLPVSQSVDTTTGRDRQDGTAKVKQKDKDRGQQKDKKNKHRKGKPGKQK